MCGDGASGTPATASENVTFNTNWNGIIAANAIAGSGNAAAVSGCTKVGFHANAWTCTYNTSGDSVSGNNPVTSITAQSPKQWTTADSATCVLSWTANSIDLTWTLAGGSSTATNTGTGGTADTCTYGGNITLPNAEPTKTGYTFSGWKLDN